MEDSAISPDDAGGAAALYFSHLELLARSESVASVDVALLSSEPRALRFESFKTNQPSVWRDLNRWCRSWNTIRVSTGEDGRRRAFRLAREIIEPESRFESFSRAPVDQLRELIRHLECSLIWAEHLLPASFVCSSSLGKASVYGHHDWASRIKRLRSGARGDSLRYKAKNLLMRRYEERLVTRFTGVASASASEAAEIQKLGAPIAAYLPPTYPPVQHEGATEALHPRVVHLGGMNTTASRLGLRRFLTVSWPIVCAGLDSPPGLWIVGSMDGASADLLSVIERAGGVCTGFVQDLREVLRPGDLHVVPWEHNTGSRTRIPAALNHGQALVSTRSGAGCFPELRSDHNCILVDDLVEMAHVIVALLGDGDRRRRIAEMGRRTFLQGFTREAVQPRFDDFLEEVMSRGSGDEISGMVLRAREARG